MPVVMPSVKPDFVQGWNVHETAVLRLSGTNRFHRHFCGRALGKVASCLGKIKEFTLLQNNGDGKTEVW